jgi:hypothetical protein
VKRDMRGQKVRNPINTGANSTTVELIVSKSVFVCTFVFMCVCACVRMCLFVCQRCESCKEFAAQRCLL